MNCNIKLCVFMQEAKDTGDSDNSCELDESSNHYGVKETEELRKLGQ